MKPKTRFLLALACAALAASSLARAGVDDEVRTLQREWETI
jgi:hypothetical protein